MNKAPREKKLAIAKKILEHEVYNKCLTLYFKKSAPLTKEEIIDIMNNSYIYNVREDSTIKRRASTVMRWLEWIINLAN